MSNYYTLLNVKKSSSPKEIKDAYNKKFLETTSADIHKELDRALVVLRISVLRYIYDHRGERGLQEPRCVETISKCTSAMASTRATHAARDVQCTLGNLKVLTWLEESWNSTTAGSEIPEQARDQLGELQSPGNIYDVTLGDSLLFL